MVMRKLYQQKRRKYNKGNLTYCVYNQNKKVVIVRYQHEHFTRNILCEGMEYPQYRSYFFTCKKQLCILENCQILIISYFKISKIKTNESFNSISNKNFVMK